MKRVFQSKSEKQTVELAADIVSILQQEGFRVVFLVGDLGSGKTTFVRGAVAAMGGRMDDVSSPTFTLHSIYECGDFDVHHYDLYRLGDPGIMIDELIECASQPNVLVFVEWPPKSAVSAIGQQSFAELHIQTDVVSEESRILTLNV